MRALAFAQVDCDGCGKAFRRMAPPHTPATRSAERALLRKTFAAAQARRWRVEGPSLMAGDACPRCKVAEVL